MKTKQILLWAVFFIVSTKTINAQVCDEVGVMANKMIKVLETEKAKAVDKTKKMSTSKTMQVVKSNWHVIAGNCVLKTGAKRLFLDATIAAGTVTSNTQHTYVSPPSEYNKVKIALKKVAGKALTEVYICVHTRGDSQQRKTFVFENGKNAPNSKLFVLNNVQGKIISVIIKAKSVEKRFKYELKAKKSD